MVDLDAKALSCLLVFVLFAWHWMKKSFLAGGQQVVVSGLSSFEEPD